MFSRLPRLLSLVLSAGLFTSCGLISDVEKLQTFNFTEAEPLPLTPGIDAAGFSGEIILIGQTNTPTRCYELRADLEDSDNDLTLRITARPISTNCPATPGGFRYQAAIAPLDAAVYHLRVIHSFPNTSRPTEEFRTDVTVR